MEFDEKDLRREISYAIKNIHGVRQVPWGIPMFSSCPFMWAPQPSESLASEAFRRFMDSFQNCINILVFKDRESACVLAVTVLGLLITCVP
jgi:hypothetical protein